MTDELDFELIGPEESVEKGGGALIVAPRLPMVTLFTAEHLDPLLDALEKEVRAYPLDVSTKAGRAAIASLAYKVSRTKTAMDDAGKELVADAKRKCTLIDAERRKIRGRLDALRDDVRRPLDEFEAIENDRIEEHERKLVELRANGLDLLSLTSDQLRFRASMAKALFDRDWQEFSARAGAAHADVQAAVTSRLLVVEQEEAQAEAERAEAERQRAAAAERRAAETAAAAEAARLATIERERQIAAAAAETARLAAIHREKLVATAAAEEARIAAEKIAAEQLAAAMKNAALQAQEQVEAARREAEEKAALELAEARKLLEEEIGRDRRPESIEPTADNATGNGRDIAIASAISGLVEFGVRQPTAINIVRWIADGKVPGLALSC